jgi:chemosensory pili system protein ChpA (sensor histidine kinase/response regulator)
LLKNAAVDRKTLAWIKEGVDETLQFMQDALTEFTENPDDTTPIKVCMGALHRVKGAVQMVEIEGAKMLAMEMEQLACALVEENVKHKIEAAEVLAAGMYQLTGYLQSLYHGQPDLPLVLLPILNDCRACQEKELFSEGDFFSPNLSVTAPTKADAKCVFAGDVATVAKKLRPGYLSGLLGVIKKENEKESLERIMFVLNNLLAVSTDEKSKQLWWIALGIVESLYNEGLQASVAVKILLGRVDRQIQRLITIGEHTFTEDPPTTVIKNLLFYVGQSQAHCDSVVEIKNAFHLESYDDTDIDKARESLYGFNVNMVDSVAEQLNEEIDRIKCELDVAMHSKGGSTEGLAPLLDNFSTITGILNMLGMSKQQQLLDEQKIFLTEKISHNGILSDDDMMGMATALLYVESSISDLAGAIHQPNEVDGLPLAEYENLLKLVAQELLEMIQSIKEAVNEYSLGSANIARLGDVPDLLKQLAGTMQTINDEQQSNLTKAINQYVCQELILNEGGANGDKLDLLADAITGLENYYQALLEESVAPELGLQVASQSITELGFPPQQASTSFNAYSHVA